MKNTIAILKEDHRHFRKVLDALAREAERFAAGESPDYDLLEAGIDFLNDYAHRVHHPLEEWMFERMCENGPVLTQQLGRLREQHAGLEHGMHALQDAVAAIRDDQFVARASLVEPLQDMIAELRAHSEWEDLHFYPTAERLLDDADYPDMLAALEAAHGSTLRPLDPRFMRLLRRIDEDAAAAEAPP